MGAADWREGGKRGVEVPGLLWALSGVRGPGGQRTGYAAVELPSDVAPPAMVWSALRPCCLFGAKPLAFPNPVTPPTCRAHIEIQIRIQIQTRSIRDGAAAGAVGDAGPRRRRPGATAGRGGLAGGLRGGEGWLHPHLHLLRHPSHLHFPNAPSLLAPSLLQGTSRPLLSNTPPPFSASTPPPKAARADMAAHPVPVEGPPHAREEMERLLTPAPDTAGVAWKWEVLRDWGPA